MRRRWFERDRDISRELLGLARALGFPARKIDSRVETWPRLMMTDLVFCPEAFDFPRSSPPKGAVFVEASIDLDRRDEEFPWERLRGDGPLVYCSVGVATFKYVREAGRLLQAYLDAMALRPEWRGVATIGGHIDPGSFRRPGNVVIVREAPQLELLKEASLMVGHGGLSGVKEAIVAGVPMVLVPLFYDQPGNAARVAHHRLGLRSRVERATADVLLRLMDRVSGDGGFTERAGRMSSTFVELQRLAPSVGIVERALQGA